MILTSKAGTALRMLCLPIALTLLASCNRQAPEPRTKPTEAEELQQDVEAIKNHPSVAGWFKSGGSRRSTSIRIQSQDHREWHTTTTPITI